MEIPILTDEPGWEALLQSLVREVCTVFVGPEVSSGFLPSTRELSNKLAEKLSYPLSNPWNLAEVSQYAISHYGEWSVKSRVAKDILDRAPRYDSTSHGSYAALASLPIPVYITTTYDDSLTIALELFGKAPVRRVCNWKRRSRSERPSPLSDPDFEPSVSHPLVFHLYGHVDDPASLVLSEDDHLDFILNFSTDEDFFPEQIRNVLLDTPLIFIGYSVREVDFRALLRGILAKSSGADRAIFAQQFVPWTSTDEQRSYLRTYLEMYLRKLNVHVLWRDTSTFLLELQSRLSQPTSHTFKKPGDTPALAPVGKHDVRQAVKIFLSYVREDEPHARALYTTLKDAGFDPWMDTLDILPGERWRSAIDKAIRGSFFFLACLSKVAVSKRGYIQRELKEALDLWNEKHEDDIYLIPVLFEECEIPGALNDFQRVDLVDDAGLERLIQAIRVGIQRRERYIPEP